MQIVKRYDVILIQEVRDSDLSATQTLMNYVNKWDCLHTWNIQSNTEHEMQKYGNIFYKCVFVFSPRDSPQYKYIVSEPLGASTYKERYLFLYRYTKMKGNLRKLVQVSTLHPEK